MLLHQKMERARKAQRIRQGLERDPSEPREPGEELQPEIEEPKVSENLEKGDLPALLLSGLLTLFLPAVLILLGLGALVLLIFGGI